MKAGQSIKEIGPTWHMSKQGTPTMGGLMFIIAIAAAGKEKFHRSAALLLWITPVLGPVSAVRR